MGFKEVVQTDAIVLGGSNKKTGKANPTSIEGYFLRTRTAGPNKFNSAKIDYVHDFQTPKGEVSVWGKPNMDNKLKKVTPGTMVRVQADGELDTGKGNPMKLFKVLIDEDNTINVAAESTFEEQEHYDEESEDTDPQDEETQPDELPPARAKPPARAAVAASVAQQSKAKGLLNNRKSV